MRMQFVIMSPTYGPSSSLIGGKYAFRNLSTQITNVAIITMYASMRTLDGITFLKIEINRELKAVQNVTPKPMAMALFMRFVTASIEHIPSTMQNVGWSCHRPAVKALNHFACLKLLFTVFFGDIGYLLLSCSFRIPAFFCSSLFNNLSNALLEPVAPVIASTSFLAPALPSGMNISLGKNSFPLNCFKKLCSLILEPRPGVSS